jgi:hypothetical protein
MFNARPYIAALSVSLLAFAAVGCTDDPGATNNIADNNRVEDPVEAPDNGQLLHVAPCVPAQDCLVDLSTTNAQDLQVQLVDADGAPVVDALISFEGQLEGTGLTLGSTNVYTNADGIATTSIQSGTDAGQTGTVTASTSNELVGTVKWLIAVNSKDSSSYRVNFEHSGASQIKPIDVRLFADSVTCDDLAANPSQTAEFERQGIVDSAGVFPTVVFPNIANGNSYTVAAWGKFLDNNDVEVAYGCTDGNDPVLNGTPVDVTVTLVDHIPTITGEYAITHDFDLTGALPDNVRTVVDLIGRLTTDPGSFVVGCPDNDSEQTCTSDNSCGNPDKICAENGRCTDRDCPAGTVGIAQLILDLLPAGNVKDSINDFLTSSFGSSVARDLITNVFDNWLNDSAPSWFSSTVNITADIYETLRRFRVTGVIRILEAPQVAIDETTGDVVGVLPPDAGYQLWDSFIFYWSQGCEDAPNPDFCAQRQPLSAADLGIEAVAGNFTGTVFGSNKLQINQHTLSLNYGALLVAVIERFVLPAIFGNNCGDSGNLACDSLELALQEMISCTDVAEFAGDQGSTLYNIAKTGCESLLTQASDSLRDYAAQNLVANGDDVFLIATPSDAHCTISQPEVYQADWHTDPLPYIQHLGQKNPAEMKCKWDVQIKFSEGYTAEVDGSFWGDRTSFLNE